MPQILSDLAGTLRSAFRIARATFDAAPLTAARTVTLPDKSGTLAMLDDVGGGSSTSEILRALLAGASVAMRNNPRTRGLVLDPPTVTVGTSTPPGGFTRVYPIEAANSPFASGGGLPTDSGGVTSFPTCTPSGSTQVGRHWRVETILDGDEVTFLLDSATADGYRFIVDGQYVSATGTTSAAGSLRYYTLTFPARGRYRIAVEGHTTLRFDEARVPDDCTLLPPERANPLRVIMVGDSNVEAFPLALKGDGIGAVLGDQFGILDVWASGVFGTGFVATNGGANYTYAQRRTDWTTRSPDVLLLCMSINDIVDGASQATIKTAVALELAQARAALPGVPIFVLGVVASEDYLSANSLLTLGGQQETGAQEAVNEANDPLIRMIPTLNAAIDSPFTGTPGTGNWPLYVDGTTHATAAGQLYGGQWMAHRIVDAVAEMAGIPAPSFAPPPPASAGGSSVWTRITGATTAVAGTPYLAVITAATDLTLPAFTAGQRFFVMNSRDSTAAVRVVVGAGNTINHPSFATGDNITAQPGETISLVAESTTELDLASPGTLGPAGPAGPQGPSDRTLHTGAFEEFPLQSAAVATPAAGFGRIYMRERAGRVTLETLGPSGVDNAVQPAFFNNRVMIISPNTTTSVSAIGISATTAATLSHPALSTASLAQSIYRTRCQTSTTAGNAAGIRHSVATMLRGNATALGGFYFHARVCTGALTLAGCEHFVGLSSSVAALAGAPSALADAVGLVKDAADARYFFVRRTGTGTAQKVDLNTSWGANLVLDVIIFSTPNGTGLGCVVRQFSNAGVATTLLDTTYTDNIPAATTFLAGRFDVRNGSTAAAADFELVRMYAESDF